MCKLDSYLYTNALHYKISSRDIFINIAQSNQLMLKCKDCPHWYGGEDFGYGSCRLKLQVNKKKFLTFGQQDCDEGLKND